MPVLNWLGKDKIINHHNEVPYKVLNRVYSYDKENGKSDIDNKSKNMIIHGDNLLALKSLMPKYEGMVDVIYIDPPYNTAHSTNKNQKWVYSDNVDSPIISKWLNKVVGDEGEDLSRHDKWLCMMYPRLQLLKKLLSIKGYIFISIDDNEFATLKLICDEIFGSVNYIGTLTWESVTQPINAGNAKYKLQQKAEFVLCYIGDVNNYNGFILEKVIVEKKYPHNGILGKCRFEIIEKSDAGSYARSTMKFKILGQYPREGKRWQIGEDTARDLEKNNRVEIVDGIVKKAVYPEDEIIDGSCEPFWSHISSDIGGTAMMGKNLLNAVMEKQIGFDTVKPKSLLNEIIKHFNNDVIILDSFAGSGTTAHAVLDLNDKDGGNRQFILVEMEDYADTITAERVKSVIDGYGSGKDKVEGLNGDFSYYELGDTIIENGILNENVNADVIKKYIYWTETKNEYNKNDEDINCLGVYDDTAYYMFYMKDKISTLDFNCLKEVKVKAKKYVIYADILGLSKEELEKYNITFKKIPRDIKKV